MLYDLIIIGGGPAGTAAGVYAARKRLTTLLITKDFGGQSTVSVDIQNWVGTPHISGPDLAKSFEDHLQTYADDVLTIQNGTRISELSVLDSGEIEVTAEDCTTWRAKSVLIATGADRRRLDVPGADEFEHRGVVYCASCDGPLFADMDVAVIGGGNAGFETAAQLLAYTKSVTLLEYHDSFKAEPITVNKVVANEKMTALTNAKTICIEGDKMVTALRYEDTQAGEEKTLAVTGVFVEIGLLPNTKFAENVLEMDNIKRIKVDPRTQRTSVTGIWAAGDCTDELYHQNNIAAGDGVKALEDIYMYLKTS
jgi:alkyl hydroperoxide reductase subunit F